MVDWRVARRIAATVAGAPDMRPPAADLIALCEDAERRVVAYARLEPRSKLPDPEWVTRAGWVDANLRGMRGVLDPVADRVAPRNGPLSEPLRNAAGLLMGAEVGGLVGLMAQRVLGQYEVPPTDPDAPARLLFVGPNLEEAAGQLGADREQLLRWVGVHEVTHAVQFSSVPWLRGHVAGMVAELSQALDVKLDIGKLRGFDLDRLRETAARLRSDGVVAAVLGPERKGLLDRVQGTMAMIEGHAEHVMDAAAVEVLPDLAELREALERRRRDRPPVMRVLEKLLGLEMKMRQYDTGKRFCDTVVAERGIEGLNRAWESPESLPTWAEMERPQGWLSRMSL